MSAHTYKHTANVKQVELCAIFGSKSMFWEHVRSFFRDCDLKKKEKKWTSLNCQMVFITYWWFRHVLSRLSLSFSFSRFGFVPSAYTYVYGPFLVIWLLFSLNRNTFVPFFIIMVCALWLAYFSPTNMDERTRARTLAWTLCTSKIHLAKSWVVTWWLYLLLLAGCVSRCVS